MKKQGLPEKPFSLLSQLKGRSIADEEALVKLLGDLSITNTHHCHIASEGVLLGSILQQSQCDDLVIISDGAGQFNIILHALCWVHTERLASQ